MKVSIGIIALNEQGNIDTILGNILEQTYPLADIELVLVDSGSSDGTKGIMTQFASEHKGEFWDVQVLDNPKRIQPAGWNVVIDHSHGDVIIRLDAHSIVPADFVQKNVDCIQSGESVCGGDRENIINGDSVGKRILLSAENNMFGSGIASYRHRQDAQSHREYVSTVAHACYRREVFDKVGRFDERLPRTEDNEMHYRIRKAGYKICCDSAIHSQYQTRPTLGGMLRQKYGNGKWIGITVVNMTPSIFSLYHFIPMLFVLGILATTITAFCGFILPAFAIYFALPAILMWGAYILLLFAISLISAVQQRQILALFALPCVIFLLHLSYGVGTLIGLCRGMVKKI